MNNYPEVMPFFPDNIIAENPTRPRVSNQYFDRPLRLSILLAKAKKGLCLEKCTHTSDWCNTINDQSVTESFANKCHFLLCFSHLLYINANDVKLIAEAAIKADRFAPPLPLSLGFHLFHCIECTETK